MKKNILIEEAEVASRSGSVCERGRLFVVAGWSDSAGEGTENVWKKKYSLLAGHIQNITRNSRILKQTARNYATVTTWKREWQQTKIVQGKWKEKNFFMEKIL